MSAPGDPTAPTVSVVMSVLDGEQVIEQALESLFAQSLPPHEVIVVNDGSTDGTSDVLRSVSDRHPGRLRVLDQSNRGIAVSLARAIDEASGDLIAVADSDDSYTPDRLRTQADLMRSNDADMVGGQTRLVYGRSRAFGTSRFPTTDTGIARRVAEGGDPLPHTTLMLRRCRIPEFGTYRDIPRASDLELMLRWARLGARIAVANDVVATHHLRREHLSVDTQFRWMLSAAFAREVSRHDADTPSFATWFATADVRAVRREARRRVRRLAARGVVTAVGFDPGSRSG